MVRPMSDTFMRDWLACKGHQGFSMNSDSLAVGEDGWIAWMIRGCVLKYKRRF